MQKVYKLAKEAPWPSVDLALADVKIVAIRAKEHFNGENDLCGSDSWHLLRK